MKFSKILSVMLAILLLLSFVLVTSSCGKDKSEGDGSNDSNGVSDVTNADTSKETEIPELEVVDLDGKEIIILWPEIHADGHYIHNEIAVTETKGDVIDMAVATRNAIVERRYNVKITAETKFISAIPKDNRTAALNGTTDCDAMVSTIKFMTTNAMEGLLTDYNALEHYDDSHTWWNHRLMEAFSIAGARYFGTGDIIYSDDLYPYCTYVNTAVSDAARIDVDYYDLVKNKEWTLEKFHSLAKQAQTVTDFTANPDKWADGETAGAVVNENFARAAYYAAGKGLIEFNEQGNPVWQMELSRTQNILERVIGIVHGDQACFNAGQFKNHAEIEVMSFNSNKTLFLVEELIISERITTTGAAADFQILPFPLYEENSEYICVLNDSAIISIPLMVEDADEICLVLSAMSRESMNTVTPAFFETVLASRYMQDAGSVETLKIILDSTVPLDVASVQDWGGFMTEFKRLAFANSTDFSSYYTGHIGEVEGEISNYIEMLKNYHS